MDILLIVIGLLFGLFLFIVWMVDGTEDKPMFTSVFSMMLICLLIGLAIMVKPPRITESIPVTTTEFRTEFRHDSAIVKSTKPIQFKAYKAAYSYSAFNHDQTMLEITLEDGQVIKVYPDKWPKELR